MRYLIKFSYDGTNYKGFQSQGKLNTIQQQINGIKTKIVATGRTDKGVHALSQYGHADIDVNITEKKLKRALNSNLPNDIHVISTKVVDNSFHARYSVKRKTYKYLINVGEYNPLERNHVYQYNYSLNINSMKQAIKYFEGKHDFRAFVTNNKEKDNCIRKIEYADIKQIDNIINITFKGTGFLRYQVRNMVGILIRVGENKINPEYVKVILESKDRNKSGKTAPPEGLYLLDIEY